MECGQLHRGDAGGRAAMVGPDRDGKVDEDPRPRQAAGGWLQAAGAVVTP